MNFLETVKDFFAKGMSENAGSDEAWAADMDEANTSREDTLEFEYEEEQPVRENRSFFRHDEEDRVSYSNPQLVSFNSGRNHEVMIVHPTSMDDSEVVSREVAAGRVVILNFEGLRSDLAQRIVDFMSGAAYAMDGHIMPVSNTIYVVTPKYTALSQGFAERQEEMMMQNLKRAAGGR